MCKLFRVDFGSQVSLLRGNAVDLLIQLLRDLYEAAPIYLAVPLQFSQLATEFEKRIHEVLHFVFVKAIGGLSSTSIAAVEELEPARILGVLLIIEAIDVL